MNTGVLVIFSEEMDASSINNATVAMKSPTTACSVNITANGNWAILRPTQPLLPNTLYTVTITKLVKNSRGIFLGADFTSSFTTGNTSDTISPHVISTDPSIGATNVSSTTVSASFSEDMDPSTITATTLTIVNGVYKKSATVSYSGTTATFTPYPGFLPNTTYTATITGARDLAGNLLADFSWEYTTGALSDSIPWVTSRLPAGSTTSVRLDEVVIAKFSIPMDRTSINTMTFQLIKQGGIVVPGTVTLDAVGTSAMFTPSAQLSPYTLYFGEVTTGAKSALGRPLSTPSKWSFTTGK